MYIFKLVMYLNWIIISNQTKYYLPTNRENFLQIQYGFYQACFTDSLSAMMACHWKSMYQEIKPGNNWNMTVWWKFMKALLLYELVHVSLVFFDRKNWNSEFPGQWQGLVCDWLE